MSTTRSPPATPSYRLTRRGRLVVLAFALLAVLVSASLLRLRGGRHPGVRHPRAHRDGDGRHRRHPLGHRRRRRRVVATPETMVEQIKTLNALDSGMVTAGQRLRVPTD